MKKMSSTTITIPTKKAIKALAYYKTVYGSNGLKLDTSGSKIEIKLDDQPEDFLISLLDAAHLTTYQKNLLIGFMPKLGLNGLKDCEVSSITELFNVMRRISTNHTKTKSTDPTLCVLVADHWYPTCFNINLQTNHWTGAKFLEGGVQLAIADQTINKSWYWGEGSFVKDDQRIKRRVIDLLRDQDLRLLDEGELEEFRRKVELCEQFRKRSKTVHNVIGPVLVHNPWSWINPLQERILGSEAKPKKVILEDELELLDDHRYHHHRGDEGTRQELPFVRAFSLDLKDYVYIDVDHIREHKFDSSARGKLVLPERMQKILDLIFEVDSNDIFGDMFAGRHGGMIVLANGRPGVGKTLTAEVFAEHTNRPLYALEMGELGTNLNSVEQNMMRIFMRATRWNAILLFDEADVFLSKRGEDLDRNAIVGVFLRLLDHYDGMLFLTTNRKEVLDQAFQSRITLYLDYPDLSDHSRERIWRHLLTAAGLELIGDLDRVREQRINGRQIRNLVRLLKITSMGTKVNEADIMPLFDFTFKAEE